MTNLCVYCSSSNRLDEHFYEVAQALGVAMAKRGLTLIYGGGNVGLMGVLARTLHEHGGYVVGVIPEALQAIEGVPYDVADELIVTQSMQERKRIMFTRADAFLVLPGGFGTLEEFFEVITLKQLGYHTKGIALLNARGFFDPLVALFDHLYATRMARPSAREHYHVAATIDGALGYLEA